MKARRRATTNRNHSRRCHPPFCFGRAYARETFSTETSLSLPLFVSFTNISTNLMYFLRRVDTRHVAIKFLPSSFFKCTKSNSREIVCYIIVENGGIELLFFFFFQRIYLRRSKFSFISTSYFVL